MAAPRRIAVFTGNRAEYGLLSPILGAIRDDPTLELLLLVGGAHLEAAYGRTRDEILQDGFQIAAEVAIDMTSEGKTSTARAIGSGILSVAQALDQLQPDVFLVYGDRFESFAALIAATQMNIPTVHVEGGDKTEGGALDDSVRHAMTKLAHIHLATNPDAAWRIAAMGEEDWRIHTIGLPVIDLIKAGNFTPAEDAAKALGLDLARPVILFTQHSITTEAEQASAQLKPSLDAMDRAIADLGAQVVATYPNNDAGGQAILADLKVWAAGNENIILRQSLGRFLYHGVLNIAGRVTNGVCMGNSSSGVKETPAFGCPALNIGARQSGRLAAANVVNVGYDAKAIYTALHRAITDDDFRALSRVTQNPYGEGEAGAKSAAILRSLDLAGVGLLQKKLTLDPEAAN